MYLVTQSFSVKPHYICMLLSLIRNVNIELYAWLVNSELSTDRYPYLQISWCILFRQPVFSSCFIMLICSNVKTNCLFLYLYYTTVTLVLILACVVNNCGHSIQSVGTITEFPMHLHFCLFAQRRCYAKKIWIVYRCEICPNIMFMFPTADVVNVYPI